MCTLSVLALSGALNWVLHNSAKARESCWEVLLDCISSECDIPEIQPSVALLLRAAKQGRVKHAFRGRKAASWTVEAQGSRQHFNEPHMLWIALVRSAVKLDVIAHRGFEQNIARIVSNGKYRCQVLTWRRTDIHGVCMSQLLSVVFQNISASLLDIDTMLSSLKHLPGMGGQHAQQVEVSVLHFVLSAAEQALVPIRKVIAAIFRASSSREACSPLLSLTYGEIFLELSTKGLRALEWCASRLPPPHTSALAEDTHRLLARFSDKAQAAKPPAAGLSEHRLKLILQRRQSRSTIAKISSIRRHSTVAYTALQELDSDREALFTAATTLQQYTEVSGADARGVLCSKGINAAVLQPSDVEVLTVARYYLEDATYPTVAVLCQLLRHCESIGFLRLGPAKGQLGGAAATCVS